MATLNLNPAIGRSSGSVTAAGCTVNATTGVITVGTVKTITGQIDTWEVTQSNETENISPSTSRNANHVITETDNSLRLEGFLFASDTIAVPTNFLFTIAQGSDLVQVVGTWAGRTETFFGMVKSYTEGIRGKGKIPFTAEFAMVDLGATANPAFA